MGRHRNSLILQLSLAVCVLLLSTSCCDATSLGRSDIHKRIEYHLRELSNGLRELRSSDVHVIHKRSALNHDEIIYNSLLAFCSQMNLDNGASPSSGTKQTGTTSSSTAKNTTLDNNKGPESKRAEIPDDHPIWAWPHVYPLKVQAERDGLNTLLVFDVIHTAPIQIDEVHSFSLKSVFVDYPDDISSSSPTSKSPAPVISKVRIPVDASQCANLSIPAFDQNKVFVFTLARDSAYHISTHVDLCMFDYFLNDTAENEKWEKKKEKTISQILPLPYIKTTTVDPGHEIMLQSGQSVVLDLEIQLSRNEQLTIAVLIWDRRNKGKIIKSNVTLRYHQNEIKMFAEKGVLSVEILEQSKLESPQEVRTEGSENKRNGGDGAKAKIRVNVDVSNGRKSGKLTMSYFYNMHNYNNPKIVEMIFCSREFLLKLPKKANVLPRNLVEISSPENFICDENGMNHYPKHGKNCTVHCYAYGTDIQDIFISGIKSRGPPVTSVSRVYRDGTSAFAMIDVGPASKENDGTYRCVAITANKKRKRRDMKLVTYLFTEVFYNLLNLTEFDNGTALINCTAFGEQPLDMSIEIENYEGVSQRVDNKTENSRKIALNGNFSTLTLLISTDQLQFPNQYVNCKADGERGYDNKHVYIENYLSSYSKPEPKIDQMPNASTIMSYMNGTVQITCTANGGKPMEMWLMYGGGSETYRIDNKPENIRTVLDTPEGQILSLFVSKESIMGPTSWITCRASNEFGEDWYDFYINNYVN